MNTLRHEYATSQAEAGLPVGELRERPRGDGHIINWFAAGLLIGIVAFSLFVKSGLLPAMVP